MLVGIRSSAIIGCLSLSLSSVAQTHEKLGRVPTPIVAVRLAARSGSFYMSVSESIWYLAHRSMKTATRGARVIIISDVV